MSEQSASATADRFREAMSRWPSGAAVLTVLTDTTHKSALVTSLASASLDPPLVQVSIRRGSRTHAALLGPEARVVVAMLTEDGSDASDVLVSVEDAAALGELDEHHAVRTTLDCAVHDVLPSGDHDIFLLRVLDTLVCSDAPPAVYHDRAFTGLRTESAAVTPDHLGGQDASGAASVEADVLRWFDERGQNTTARLEAERQHPVDFVRFVEESRLLSRTLVPGPQGWSPRLAATTSEALASHGFTEWLMWHVSSLAALPVWMSSNARVQQTYRDGFERGVFGAFGMSERAAGADWRHTRSQVTRVGDRYVADAQKDYSGNAQSSELVTTFARFDDAGAPGFAFFRADARRPGYLVERNAVPHQMFVAQFRLQGYTFGADDLVATGDQAFADAVNTLNVGKFNLATASVAMARRALSETLRHTQGRHLFGQRVAEFGQVRRALDDAALRLVVLRAYNEATIDSLERASAHDSTYRLMTSIAKSLVTQQSVQIVRDLGQAISAASFETESTFRMMAQYVEWLPRLEGTRYVNMMQSIRAARGFFDHLRSGSWTPVRVLDDAGPTGTHYLLSGRRLGGLRAQTYAGLDLTWRDAGETEAHDLAVLVDALGEVFREDPPTSAGHEERIEALGEVFTRVFAAVVVMTRIQRSAREPALLAAVADWLMDDLLRTVLSHRHELDLPPGTREVVARLAGRSAPASGLRPSHLAERVLAGFQD